MASGNVNCDALQLHPASMDPEPAVRLTAHDDGSAITRYIHRAILCSRAPFFIELTQDADTVDFPDWRPETIGSFADWVLYNRIIVRGLNYEGEVDLEEAAKVDNTNSHTIITQNGQHVNQQDEAPPQVAYRPWYDCFSHDPIAQVLARVLDLYVFALVGKIPTLQVECILTWQRLICGPRNIVLYGSIVRAVMDRTGSQTNEFCDFVFEWVAFTLRDDLWSHANMPSLHPNALAKILRLALRRANSGVGGRDGVVDPNADWCRYHGHATGLERDACRAIRPNDFDVRTAANRQRQNRDQNQCQNQNQNLNQNQDGQDSNPLPDMPTPSTTVSS